LVAGAATGVGGTGAASTGSGLEAALVAFTALAGVLGAVDLVVLACLLGAIIHSNVAPF